MNLKEMRSDRANSLALRLSAPSKKSVAAKGARRFWPRFVQDEGSSLIEFAFTLPIMMVLLTGCISFSLGLFSLQQLGNATASTTQLLAADGGGLIGDPCATAVTNMGKMLPGWTAANFSYSLSVTDTGGTAHPYPSSGTTKGTGFSCAAGGAQMGPNQPVTLQVTYPYSWLPIAHFNWTWSPSTAFSLPTSITVTESALME